MNEETYLESADMREVYKRLAERHANELREHGELCAECSAGRDCNRLSLSRTGVEGR